MLLAEVCGLEIKKRGPRYIYSKSRDERKEGKAGSTVRWSRFKTNLRCALLEILQTIDDEGLVADFTPACPTFLSRGSCHSPSMWFCDNITWFFPYTFWGPTTMSCPCTFWQWSDISFILERSSEESIEVKIKSSSVKFRTMRIRSTYLQFQKADPLGAQRRETRDRIARESETSSRIERNEFFKFVNRSAGGRFMILCCSVILTRGQSSFYNWDQGPWQPKHCDARVIWGYLSGEDEFGQPGVQRDADQPRQEGGRGQCPSHEAGFTPRSHRSRHYRPACPRPGIQGVHKTGFGLLLLCLQITHSITLLTLVHQNIYNSLTLLVSVLTQWKSRRIEEVKTCFGDSSERLSLPWPSKCLKIYRNMDILYWFTVVLCAYLNAMHASLQAVNNIKGWDNK